ncbi:MAG: UbiA family prenyltransferase [Pirellulaceae bacterium]
MNIRASKLLDYFRLFRLTNVFTAIADVTMGFLFVHHTLQPWPVFLTLAAASCLLYTAGMVLNDVGDIEQDRRERPERPLPAGRIALASARRLGWTLLVGGVLCGWLAGRWGLVEEALVWRSGLVATLLAACVVAYDGGLKRTPAGPLAMGACRLLNVLLGMSVAAPWVDSPSVIGYGTHHLLAASGIGLYIAGVTWFARTEATVSGRWSLGAGTVVMLAGIGLLGALHAELPSGYPRHLPRESTWLLLLGLLTFVIVRRCVIAVIEPSPRRVQQAVRNSLWSLIFLDAAVALLVSPPGWSLVILAYLVPTMVLGNWIEST